MARVVLWIEAVCVSLILALSGLQAWSSRRFVNADGVSYLDLSDAYLRRDTAHFWNDYWSPMYSWLLALGRAVFRPAPLSEYTFAHFVNFGILVWALLAFRFLVRELLETRRERMGTSALSEAFFVAASYGLFLWSSVVLITLRVLTPDLLFAGFVYLAAGLLVRTGRRKQQISAYVLLGFVLALGYFAKVLLFPIAFAFLAVAAFLPHFDRRSLLAALAATAVFLFIAGLWIVPLSKLEGRVTVGDAGKLNYAWYVNDLAFRHWQGGPPEAGRPVHPTRRVLEEPPVYEFASPVVGTYPVWDDPGYWYEGARVHVDVVRELIRLRVHAKLYYRTFFNPHVLGLIREHHVGLIFTPLFLAYLVTVGVLGRPVGRRIRGRWMLAVPALAGIGLMSLVYVEARHIAAFVVLLLLALLIGVGSREAFSRRRVSVLAALLLAVGYACVFVDVVRPLPIDPGRLAPRSTSGLVAAGLRPGIRLASLDYSTNHLAWARTARARFVAEIYRDAYLEKESTFWKSDAAARARVLDAFRRAGAGAVVAKDAPKESESEGWKRIPETRSSVLLLR